MGALIAKLLSFFGFRTAIAESADGGTEDNNGSGGHRPSRSSGSGYRASRQSIRGASRPDVSRNPSATARMHIRKKSSVVKPGHVVRKVQWTGEAQLVFVTGSWLNWEEKVELSKNPNSEEIWEADVEFPNDAGDIFELQFLVDDAWMTSSDMPTTTDDQGNVNNSLILSETENSQSSLH